MKLTFRLVMTVALVLPLLVATGGIANAGGTVSGRVTDRSTGAPIAGVCVTVGPVQNCVTFTDTNGNYSVNLTGAPNGGLWEFDYIKDPDYDKVVDFITLNGNVVNNVTMKPHLLCADPIAGSPTQSVYLPNITKTLGGATGFQTPFIVQNTGATATNLEVSFYRFSDGKCITRRTVNALAPGASFADVPNNDTDLPGDSQFSVVVRSFGASVVSVVNEHAGFGDRAEALSYDGFSAGATSVFLPNIVRRFFGFHTPFIMQNLGTTSTVATAKFVPFDGSATVNATRTIAPGQSQFIEPNIEPGLVDGKQYAVTVTATQPLAVVVNTHNDDPSVAAPVAYSTDGIAGGGSNVYGPYAAKNANNSGRTGTISTIVVQNLGGAPLAPALRFTPLGGGTAVTFTGPSTPAGGAWAFDPRFLNGAATSDPTKLCPSAGGTGCLADGEYSFVATAGGTIAAAVNVISSTSAMGYTASASPAVRFFLPNVTRNLGGAAGWTTPIMLQSASATGATLTWKSFTTGASISQTVTMSAGSALRIDPRSVPGLIDDRQYAVTVQGSAGTVNAIVVELASGGDNAMIYEGFPSP